MENDFERQLLEGCYKNSKEFISEAQNLKRVIAYLNRAEVRPQVMEVVLGLLRFFRFPLALCCSRLYHHIANAPPEQLEPCRDRLLEIAAYVKSLISEMGLPLFPEIEFFLQWGHARKKFNVSVVEQEREFGRLIL
jgi:hypothetical protein